MSNKDFDALPERPVNIKCNKCNKVLDTNNAYCVEDEKIICEKCLKDIYIIKK